MKRFQLFLHWQFHPSLSIGLKSTLKSWNSWKQCCLCRPWQKVDQNHKILHRTKRYTSIEIRQNKKLVKLTGEYTYLSFNILTDEEKAGTIMPRSAHPSVCLEWASGRPVEFVVTANAGARAEVWDRYERRRCGDAKAIARSIFHGHTKRTRKVW